MQTMIKIGQRVIPDLSVQGMVAGDDNCPENIIASAKRTVATIARHRKASS